MPKRVDLKHNTYSWQLFVSCDQICRIRLWCNELQQTQHETPIMPNDLEIGIGSVGTATGRGRGIGCDGSVSSECSTGIITGRGLDIGSGIGIGSIIEAGGSIGGIP
ncbi:hypothetical protein ACH3XW_47265 [Acanthocheilonema viteae]